MSWILLASLVSLPPLFPLDDIKPGQTGTCLTVFEGDTIEPFNFVVKGRMRNFLGPKKDLVMIKLVGEKPEFTGVVAGMSGSPCSIDGKLVGALSYSFATFAKEPIAGVTPMQMMLDVMKLPDESRPFRILGESSSAWNDFRDGKAPSQTFAAAQTTDPSGLAPIATPLSVGGLSPELFRHFEPWLRGMGFEPMAGGGGASSTGPTKLQPGSAIAAILVRGDLDIAATGTVTSVEGNEVLGFGHPFVGVGAISVPMAGATIINTMASAMRSFKMAASGPVLGEVTQDRLSAIGGYLGRKAAMMPVRGTVKAAGKEAAFAFEIARDPTLTPRLLAMALGNAVNGRVEASTRGTARVDATLRFAGEKTVKLRSSFAGEREEGLMLVPAMDVAEVFDLLWDTPFGPAPKAEIELTVAVEPEPVVEWIETMQLDRATARPGEKVEVAVRMRREGKGVTTERFNVAIPASWAGESIELVAASAQAANSLTQVLMGTLRPENRGDIVKWLEGRSSDGALYLLALRSGTALRSGMQMLPSVPASFAAMVAGEPKMQKRGRSIGWRDERPRPGTLEGMASAVLQIENSGVQ